MEKLTFARNEFLSRLELDEATLREWEKLKLLKPVGYTDEKLPVYSRETAERVKHIQKLAELGYGLAEIQKILKKVGLPESGESTKSPGEGSYLTIGNLAERVGLSPRTIKHWEDKGIIEPDMRSEGGFRLYSRDYVFACELIRDLQLFGYTLEEIKDVSDCVRDFLAIRNDPAAFPRPEVTRKLDRMLKEVQGLSEKMKLLDKGVKRWKDLIKKKKKEVLDLKMKNEKKERKKPEGEIG